MRILHVAAEAHPLIKTGGLADVVGVLPRALEAQGVDARLLLPGYPAVLAALAGQPSVLTVGSALGPAYGAASIRLLLGSLPDSSVPLYVIDAPWLYARAGNPYVGPDGQAWADNYLRFGLLGYLGAQLAVGGLDRDWSPDVLHAHDWHAGLAPVYLQQHPARAVSSVFTIHNLAFQGRFPLEIAQVLGFLPSQVTPASLEFHGDLSFMKGALTAADAITTVSPGYAREILTNELGEGMEGVLRARASDLSGILNGIDTAVWDPASDAAIACAYDSTDSSGKAANKRALQEMLGLVADAQTPLFAIVGRMTAQKGLDLLLEVLVDPALSGIQFVMLGSGVPAYEQACMALAAAHPGRVAARITFDETLSHRIFAGADAIVVPSRFEPCGLTQLYGLRYGTVPIVRRTGGLGDTVRDEQEGAAATGFLFEAAQAAQLLNALVRAAATYRERTRWAQLIRNGMNADFSWAVPASAYRALYGTLINRSV